MSNGAVKTEAQVNLFLERLNKGKGRRGKGEEVKSAGGARKCGERVFKQVP